MPTTTESIQEIYRRLYADLDEDTPRVRIPSNFASTGRTSTFTGGQIFLVNGSFGPPSYTPGESTWTTIPETEPNKEDDMTKYTEMRVTGDQIQDGDHVLEQWDSSYTKSKGTWNIIAVRSEKGLGWRFLNGGSQAEVKGRWTPGTYFTIRRPVPEENEFGRVMP